MVSGERRWGIGRERGGWKRRVEWGGGRGGWKGGRCRGSEWKEGGGEVGVGGGWWVGVWVNVLGWMCVSVVEWYRREGVGEEEEG